MLQVRLLGQFDVRADGKRVVIPSRAGQSLFAYLLLSAGTAHRRERLAGLLWPETSDDNARRNLRQELWRVRKTIGSQRVSNGEYIQAEEFTVTFNPEADYWLDVAQLDRPVAADDVMNDLINQLVHYQGELLPGFYDDWIVLERERVQALFENKMKQLMGALCREQRWSTVLEWGERWIALGQTPEPAYRALMAAYAALGDRSKIVVTFERCEAALDKDLGVTPSEETRTLRDRLLEDEGEALKAETLELIRLASPNLHPSNFVPHPLRQEEPPASGEPPFKGLQFFDESDAALFFGRELLTAQLVRHLRESQFLAVIVGASGSGKSSIVRAGLIPALKRGEPLADDTLPPAGSSQWPVYIITPTAHPLEALAIALTREVESVTATATLQDDLARDPRSLLLYLHRTHSHSLLVVDQFEELFTLCRDEFEREAFIDNLLTALTSGETLTPSPSPNKGEGGITLILTLRADFYAHLAQYPELRDAVAKQQEYIGPMTADELRRAIEEPAKHGGWEFEPGLVDLMLRDVGDEPGALPLLSHALLETWQRRSGRTLTLKGYADAGGVRGAIAYTAETVYQELSPEQQSIARNIFLRLTELGEGTEDTRRRATITELLTQPQQADQVRAVLNILADARLVTTGEDSAEVAHEALIREWPRLRGWLNDDREGLLLHRHLTEATHEWDLLDHDPDTLYRGARLAQTMEWAALNAHALNRQERAFLDASQELEQREAAEREAQRQRELAAAQRLAEEQQQRADEQSRNAKRLRRRAVYLAGAFVLAIVLAGFALFFGEQARQKAIDEQAANRIATSRELAAASIANLNVDPERSILLALRAEGQADTFQAQDALHQAVQTSRVLKRAPVSAYDCDCSIAYSPDGTRLAVESFDDNGQMITQIRDAATLEVLFTKSGVWADDRWLYADRLPIFAPGSDAATSVLTVWDATGQRVITSTTLNLSPSDILAVLVDLSPDLTTLAVPKFDGYNYLYDIATGQQLRVIGKPDHGPARVLFSPDGKSLLTLYGFDNEVVLWDVASGRELKTWPTQDNLWLYDFSPDGQRIAFNDDVIVRIVDTHSGQDVMKLIGHTGLVQGGLQFDAAGTRLATQARDGTARIWDVATGQTQLTLFGHDLTWGVAFSPNGTQLATISEASVQTWGIAPTDSREVLTVPSEVSSNSSIAFSPDGTQLALFGTDQAANIVDVPSGQTRLTLPTRGREGLGFAFSPDGTRLATSGDDPEVQVWDRATGRPLLSLKGHTDRVDQVIFSPDGSRLATLSHDRTARLWDATTGQMLFLLPAYDEQNVVYGNNVDVAFSPDGSRLATAGGSSIKIWDTSNGQQVLALPQTKELFAYTVAFSPDGKQLAVGFRWGAANVWDVATGRKLFDLPGHSASVLKIAYSPDGSRIATTSVDGTARLWDATTGAEQLALTGHTGQIGSLAFSPDGTQLATGGTDGTVRVYALRPDDLVKIAQSRVTRSLTKAECQKYLHVEECPATP